MQQIAATKKHQSIEKLDFLGGWTIHAQDRTWEASAVTHYPAQVLRRIAL